MNIQEMDPIEHDQHIAYVSHISHISSFMLGKTVMEKEDDEKAIFDMAGSGFASTVRLAKSSPEMWTPIFKQNNEPFLFLFVFISYGIPYLTWFKLRMIIITSLFCFFRIPRFQK